MRTYRKTEMLSREKINRETKKGKIQTIPGNKNGISGIVCWLQVKTDGSDYLNMAVFAAFLWRQRER